MTRLRSIIDKFVIDVRFDFESEDEEFFDVDDEVEEPLSATSTRSHKFLKNRETSVIDNSII